MNEKEFLNFIATGQELPMSTGSTKQTLTPKFRRFTNRLYKITASKPDRRFKAIVIENVGHNNRQNEIDRFRELGYTKIISEETFTIVNEKVGKEVKSREMLFARQIFAAANDKAQPMPIAKVEANAAQRTIAWELFDNLDNAWLDNRSIVKVSDRNAKVKAERKRLEMYNRHNNKGMER